MTDRADHLIACLPQKSPFLFLDEVTEQVYRERAVGRKVFPVGDPVFENHLPGRPLVPGVILIEALAQLSGIVLMDPDDPPDRGVGFLAGVDGMRFKRLIEPDEPIRLTSEVTRRFGSAARFRVEATVAGEPAADGDLILGGVGGDE